MGRRDGQPCRDGEMDWEWRRGVSGSEMVCGRDCIMPRDRVSAPVHPGKLSTDHCCRALCRHHEQHHIINTTIVITTIVATTVTQLNI